jgi:uncharacterized repeat protein (TIGR02543 family)
MVTVSFNMNGGTIMTPVQLLPGDVLDITTEPLKEHYDFVGWYTDSNYITEWVTGSIVNNSMILYARWTPTTYTVNFYDAFDPYTIVSSVDVVYGDSIPAPVLTRTGYTFAGWYTYDEELYNVNTTPTSDLDLYAVWTAIIYTITYLDADGNVYVEYEYTYGEDVHISHPDGPIREYYDFVGWVGTLPDTMPSENIVITPEYAKRVGVIYVTITITIVYEDGTEEIITIEVPQDEVENIIAQYYNN